ncbi:MAG: pilus assembly protein [Bradymonadaceae bacterium]|nr:pilus assembly protein [Lujinxingiaceae bacterium]
MESGSNQKKPRRASGLASTMITALCHLVGIAAVFAILAAAFINESALSALQGTLSDSALSGRAAMELALQLGLAACVWALGFIMYAMFREHFKSRKTTRLVRARGTILTETLIVFPVFILLTFGLAQMTINNMAGLLTTLAAYEAGRTLAVWMPEAQAGRNGVTPALAHDKARVAAAGVIAPVVPQLFSTCNPNSPTLQKKLAGLHLAGNVPHYISLQQPLAGSQQFTDAFDKAPLGMRGIPKTRMAYCSTTVTSSGASTGGLLTTKVVYRHNSAMPLVGRLFGSLQIVEGRPGFYANIQRSYRTTTHMAPNKIDPY